MAKTLRSKKSGRRWVYPFFIVILLAAAGIEDPFGLQQKLLAHPELASKLSGVFAELTLDIIKSEKA